QLAITTTIHDALRTVVGGATQVGLGAVVHDTASVTGQVAGFDIGAVSFTLDAVSVGTSGSADGSATARSVDSAPLAAGSHTYNANGRGPGRGSGDTHAARPPAAGKQA